MEPLGAIRTSAFFFIPKQSVKFGSHVNVIVSNVRCIFIPKSQPNLNSGNCVFCDVMVHFVKFLKI